MTAKRGFTDRFLKSIKPAAPGQRYIIYDAAIPQFGIRVTDKSTKYDVGSFVLVARFPGSTNPAPRQIGAYPAMTLAQGREIAREWREDICRGIDPKVKEERRRHEEELRLADTFAAVFAAFADDHLATLRTGRAVKGAIAKHVLPRWGQRPISEIKRVDVNELVRILRKDAPIGTNRVLAYLKKFFAWAVDQEIIESSPAILVKRPTRENTRDRVLSDVEIRTIWQACGDLGAFGRAFRFMLATGQRLSEVGKMTWNELNLIERLWTLPRGRTKADRSHEVPLSNVALAILEECPKFGDFVFTTGGTRPISGWSKAKARLLKRMGAQEHGADWRLHDLRRTCATNLARCGADRITIGKILNHAENEVTAVYDRHGYDREKREALDRWSERLAGIVGQEANSILIENSPA
jgi:integrase